MPEQDEPHYDVKDCPKDKDGKFSCPTICWGC